MVNMAHSNLNSNDLFWNAHSGLNKLAAEKQCRMCERSHKIRPLTRHHLVPLSYFQHLVPHLKPYRNANANIIPLCRPCHDLVEQDREARRMLSKLLSQQEIAFAIKVASLEWLNDRYPPERSRPTASSKTTRSKMWNPTLTEIAHSEKSLARRRGLNTATTSS